ncbi:glycosyltransferase family 4 protein [Alistipes sp. ZOR0009]|uniref:glycosyltransferase family 4 protein n=1 Tax=Alistipes sp. ZOR0009 TaxID=1339253 RepID=UPI0009E06238|nr:glycosyltransferase family 4 protein [Alistipes sp. ZOR0009]
MNANTHTIPSFTSQPTEILVVTSYPPRECGIATYSQDLVKSITKKFGDSFSIKICALESGPSQYSYPPEVKLVFDTSDLGRYQQVAQAINRDSRIKIVVIQHEFGFYRLHEEAFTLMVSQIEKPVVIVFHTVLPHPNEALKAKLIALTKACTSIVVMTNRSREVLVQDYDVPLRKIVVIPHGTHLVAHLDKNMLKRKHGLEGRKVLSTFGLLSSGKNIETTLQALPSIVKAQPEVMFLIIGKTHPEVVKSEGEVYRQRLTEKVKEYGLQDNVRFINSYLALPELLEYLQLSDIYVFSSNDPNQAVSGTFAYAMSCGCPIISTPIPHAKEVLTSDTGIIFDFGNSVQLADSVVRLLNDDQLRRSIRINTLQKIVSTAWENSAEAHARLLSRIADGELRLKYQLPGMNLNHIKKLTTDFGMVQFSKVNQPDLDSGYTLDDNARALVALCMHYEATTNRGDLFYIKTYLNFIRHCQQADGKFLNYVDREGNFTVQNAATNLDDANGRAIWALGYLVSQKAILPSELVVFAQTMLQKSLPQLQAMHSTRALAFAIKGLYFYFKTFRSDTVQMLVRQLANRLANMYRHESESGWRWFESYLTYANSVLPEAMLYAWLVVDDAAYKLIAFQSFDFLLSQTFTEGRIEVISNRGWHQKGKKKAHFGEQPIDVAYTIMALSKFYEIGHQKEYLLKMQVAFSWFLGNNHLRQTIYNPCTGGCYDGLEQHNINLNQGAESAVSYLMARLTVEAGVKRTLSPPMLQLGYIKRKYAQHQLFASTYSQRRVIR